MWLAHEAGVVRVAMVVETAVDLMQLRRVGREDQQRAGVELRHLDAIDDAEEWLSSRQTTAG
jgi:hypothetical protein